MCCEFFEPLQKTFHHERVPLDTKQQIKLWEVNISIQDLNKLCLILYNYKEYQGIVFYQDNYKADTCDVLAVYVLIGC